jgi:hypothetical protein
MVFVSLIYNSGRCIGCGFETLYTVSVYEGEKEIHIPSTRTETETPGTRAELHAKQRDRFNDGSLWVVKFRSRWSKLLFNAHFNGRLLRDLAHALNVFSR